MQEPELLKHRLQSLDAFRGITIAGMILVNNPGSWAHIYPPLRHAEWHGWTPTDLIFPFFLFIVGVAIPFALTKYMDGRSKRFIYWKIIRRTLVLFALGLFLAGFPKFNLETIRIPGVLQRIAVVYFVASLIFLHTRWKTQALIGTSLLLLYWGLMTFIPVPGYGAGNLSPEGNLAAYIDRALLRGHLWKGTWDPEGILSTIPAIATALAGVLTGHWLRSGRDRREIAGWMFVAGWMAIIVGLFWGIVFPINKNLWTSSYVIFTAGAALQFLAFCYWLMDVAGYRRWAKPAMVYGVNALAVFVLSGLVARLLIIIKMTAGDGQTISLKTWLYREVFASWLSPVNASLVFALSNILFWWAVMALLYRKQIFVKI